MVGEKLVIPQKKYRGETAVVSVRLPQELIGRIDDAAARLWAKKA